MSHDLCTLSNGEVAFIGDLSEGRAWHGLGRAVHDLTYELVREYLELGGGHTELVEMFARLPDGQEILSDQLAIIARGRVQGVCSERFRPVQDQDIVLKMQEAFEPLGGRITSGMILAGGAKSCFQVKFPQLEAATIRAGDDVQPYVFVTNGHDGKTSVRGGFTATRIVCMNTLMMALSNAVNLLRFRHQGKVSQKADNMISTLSEIRASFARQVEVWRFLASVPVRNKVEVTKFVQGVKGEPMTGTYESREGKRGRDPMSLVHDVEFRFMSGIGNRGESYWDLFNAWTERSTHESGNAQAGDRAGDQAARRLDSLYFGSIGASNVKALDVATQLAKAA